MSQNERLTKDATNEVHAMINQSCNHLRSKNSLLIADYQKTSNAPRKPVYWEDLLIALKSMADRQQKIEPLLPLRSATVYKANFEMYKYVQEILEAEEQVCLYHFGSAACNSVNASILTGSFLVQLFCKSAGQGDS